MKNPDNYLLHRHALILYLAETETGSDYGGYTGSQCKRETNGKTMRLQIVIN